VIRRISILFFGFVLCLPAFDRQEYTRTFDRTLTVRSGQKVVLEHKFGDIEVRTHPQQEVTIHADIRVSAGDSNEAKQYAERVEVLVEPSSELSIRTRYPDAPRSFLGFRNVSFSVHYELTIPETSPLQVRNSFGGVLVSGLKTSSEIVTSHGELRFHDGRGAQRLENSFARVELVNNVGDVNVETTNGAVDVSDVTGMLTVRDRFANVTASRISNGVNITNGNGSVDLGESGGPADIKSSFGRVVVHNLRGDLIVSDTNGAVDATNISGAATLNTAFGDVTFFDIGRQLSVRDNNAKVSGNKVGGSLAIVNSFGAVQVSEIQHDVRIESGNGAVSVDKAGGAADLKTSFGSVQASNIAGMLTVVDANGSVRASNVRSARVNTSFGAAILDGVAGAVQVQNQNGAVEVSSTLKGSCQPLAIRTSFAAIRLLLQADASYRVSARTSFGKIRSDFPLAVLGSLSNDEVNGTIGSGRCEMSLTDNNGAIEILKQ
jgi:hypothetical protein